jgi:hypothetical protein
MVVIIISVVCLTHEMSKKKIQTIDAITEYYTE